MTRGDIKLTDTQESVLKLIRLDKDGRGRNRMLTLQLEDGTIKRCGPSEARSLVRSGVKIEGARLTSGQRLEIDKDYIRLNSIPVFVREAFTGELIQV